MQSDQDTMCAERNYSTMRAQKGKSGSISNSNTTSKENGHVKETEGGELKQQQDIKEPTYIILFFASLSYWVLTVFGYLRVFLQQMGLKDVLCKCENNRDGYVPLYESLGNLHRNFVMCRLSDCFDKPISSRPGAYVDIVKEPLDTDYSWEKKIHGKTIRILNMGSYNYLGFADNLHDSSDSVAIAIRHCGIGICSTRQELGTSDHHLNLERSLAKFLKTEDCLVVGQGFSTNSTCIPTLVGRGSLIFSDEYNHSSIVLGSRLSGASIRVFKHNNMVDLEAKLKDAVLNGQSRTHRKWRNILIIVEGIYSMEGTIVNLPEIIRLKKKYMAYLFLDEAHSIGSLGHHGRGVVDYYGCNSGDIDIMMGTFTKSFSAAGGYVAGSKQLINHIRRSSFNFCYGTSMSAPVVLQIMNCIDVIKNKSEGRQLLCQLAFNTRYFRKRLREMGFMILGSEDSPVVPLLIILPAKVSAFSRLLEQRGVAVAVVIYPATPLLECRARFCISASHTTQMLDHVLAAVDEIGDTLCLKYAKA